MGEAQFANFKMQKTLKSSLKINVIWDGPAFDHSVFNEFINGLIIIKRGWICASLNIQNDLVLLLSTFKIGHITFKKHRVVRILKVSTNY